MKCVKCKAEAVEGKKRCQKHLDMHVVYTRNWQAKQRAMGKCEGCGKPSDTRKCPTCAKSNKESRNKWEQDKLSKGKCADCGREAVKGRRRCRKCMDRRMTTDRKYISRIKKEKRCWHCARPIDEFSLMQNKKSCMVCRQGRVGR